VGLIAATAAAAKAGAASAILEEMDYDCWYSFQSKKRKLGLITKNNRYLNANEGVDLSNKL
jgi:hypothetical protein